MAQGGPLPVLSRVLTPLIGVKWPQPNYVRPFIIGAHLADEGSGVVLTKCLQHPPGRGYWVSSWFGGGFFSKKMGPMGKWWLAPKKSQQMPCTSRIVVQIEEGRKFLIVNEIFSPQETLDHHHPSSIRASVTSLGVASIYNSQGADDCKTNIIPETKPKHKRKNLFATTFFGGVEPKSFRECSWAQDSNVSGKHMNWVSWGFHPVRTLVAFNMCFAISQWIYGSQLGALWMERCSTKK